MIQYNIINLVGRHKHVMEAGNEIFSHIIQNHSSPKKVLLTMTNPVTFKPILRPMVSIKDFYHDKNYEIIINAFPSTSTSNLVDLNDYITYKSRCIYQNTNYFVCPKYIKPEFLQSTLTKKPIYHDIFSLIEDKDQKFKKLDFILGSNVTRNI
jgi:hypothetical protein